MTNKLIIFIFFFITFIFLNINKYILLLSKFYQIRKNINFLNECFKINNNKRNINFNRVPKISVVIPVFNCENSINFSINSIRNQNFEDIEILLVNDFSTDSSKYIIDNLQKEDPRIIIINNNKNMGTLYSRNIGVIYSKGKYIFALDNDDLFLNKNIFTKMYKTAEKYNYDIIGFNSIYSYNYKSKINKMFIDPFIKDKTNQIIYQPNLKFLSLTNNDVHVWGKCIKNEIYKKAISLLGTKRGKTYLCNAEDDVIIYILFGLAKTFRYIPIFGIFHLISSITASNTLPKDHLIFSKIFFLDLIFDFTDASIYEKKYVVNFAKVIKRYSIINNLPLNEKNLKYLKCVLKKIFDCPFISKEDKTDLKKIFYQENII